MKKGILIGLAAVLFLTGCGNKEEETVRETVSEMAAEGENTAGKEKTVLVLAAFGENRKLNKQIEQFNRENGEYEIQIKMYERSSDVGEDGVVRLQREIMSGEGPDLIDFGWDYTTSDIVGKYTEDLFPFMERAGIRREDFFANVWDAFCYQGGLYAMPVSFTLETFVGEKEALGGRTSWTVDEMIECYQEKSDQMMLYPGEMKKDVFGTILTGSMDTYIDWESGECSFDGEAFRQVLMFANMFPDSLNIAEDFSIKQKFLDGEALLLKLRLSEIYDICKAELIFGEKDVAYIGFPLDGECGTVIRPSYPMLAISIGSEYKEAAWEFIVGFLDEQYQKELTYELPVRRSVLEGALLENREPEYETDAEGNQKMKPRSEIIFQGEEPVELYCVTEKQADELIDLIESATVCATTDFQLYNVFLEEADSYFSGDKSLEEAAAVIQSRASIYVGERKR